MSILPSANDDGKQRGDSRRGWTLQFRFNHQSNWLGALAEIKDTANNNVRNAIKSRFDNLLESAKQRREFEIEDLDAQISILIAAYDVETKRRLAYLTEQAAIAREIGLSKQTNIPQPSIYQSLNTQGVESLGNISSKIEDQTLLYLRGYNALEKEIELIKSRQDKRPFVEGLLPLAQKKLALSKDQIPERGARLFAKTPVMKSDNFQAAAFDVNATEFKYDNRERKLKLALAALVGGMIGVIYVLITSAMRRRREADAS